MRNTKDRSLIISILSFCFIIGLAIFSFKLVLNSEKWTMNLFNKHISGNEFSNAGSIMDANDVILAMSTSGKRIYNDDIATRKAMLHTIGDSSINFTTSIQNNYKGELFGYSFITGVNPPPFLKRSKDITLTVDSSVCKLAFEKFGDRKGAACVYNYKTGDLKVIMSVPTYDPKNPPNLNKDTSGRYNGVYVNRAISGAYTPGSVFKVITATSALENLDNAEEKSYTCQKVMPIDGKKITCLGYHGNINLKNAMMKSCNIYFANLAIDLSKDKMTATTKNLGFGENFEFNRVKTKASNYDVSNADNYQLGWSGVGQANDLVNPIHMMMIMGSIGNGGEAVLPNIVKNIKQNSETFLNLPDISFNESSKKSVKFMSKETADKLKDILRYTVKNNYGDSMFPNLEVCAKTGTAETGEKTEPHSWMAGFSLKDETPYAFCVIVENGGSGISTAGPIASAIMQDLVKKRKS